MEQDNKRPRSKAVNRAALRGAIAVYLIYLGISLIVDLIQGRITERPYLIWAAAIVFALGGLGFAWFTWRRWKIDAAEEKAEAEKEAVEASETE